MEERRIEGIMYGKFNSRDKHMALLKADRKGVTVIDKPFKDILRGELETNKCITQDNTDKMDELFIWECAFNKNNGKVGER